MRNHDLDRGLELCAQGCDKYRQEEEEKRSRMAFPSILELEGSPQILYNPSRSGGSERLSNLSKVTQLGIGLEKMSL